MILVLHDKFVKFELLKIAIWSLCNLDLFLSWFCEITTAQFRHSEQVVHSRVIFKAVEMFDYEFHKRLGTGKICFGQQR